LEARKRIRFLAVQPSFCGCVHPNIVSERLGHLAIVPFLVRFPPIAPGLQAIAVEQVDAAIKAVKKRTIE